MSWLQKVFHNGKTCKALDILYDDIDQLLLDGEFSKVNLALEQICVPSIPTVLLLGVLTITMTWRTQLPARVRFFKLVQDELKWRGQDLRSLDGLE